MAFDPSTLTGRMADIWHGRSGLAPDVEQQYRDLWMGQPVKQPSNACVYRGEFLESYVECPTCAPEKTVKLRLYGCQLFGQCVIGKSLGKLHGCLEPCQSRLEPEAVSG